MILKLLGNVSLMIAREVNLVTWEIIRKRNYAMIDKINNIFHIFMKQHVQCGRGSVKVVICVYFLSECGIICLKYRTEEFLSQVMCLKVTDNFWY